MPAPTKSTITPPTISVPTGGLESAFSERVCCAEESWARSDASTASSAGNAGARPSSASTPESSGATGAADSAPSVDPSEVGDESSFAPAPGVAESLGLGVDSEDPGAEAFDPRGLGEVVLEDDDPGLGRDVPDEEDLGFDDAEGFDVGFGLDVEVGFGLGLGFGFGAEGTVGGIRGRLFF